MTAPSSALSIRKATPPDVALIREIAHQTWPVAYKEILSPQSLQYMLGYFYSEDALEKQIQEGQQFFIAELDNLPVGFGSVSLHAPGTCKLNKLYVLPQQQKTGAGRALMDEAFRLAKTMNAAQLILNVNRNNPARFFYEKLGFSIIKEEDVDLGNGVVQEDYVMAKPVG